MRRIVIKKDTIAGTKFRVAGYRFRSVEPLEMEYLFPNGDTPEETAQNLARAISLSRALRFAHAEGNTVIVTKIGE